MWSSRDEAVRAQTEILGQTAGDARRTRLLTVAALIAFIILGAGLRLGNLGKLGFTVDEGFHALAVEGVLQHGVPRMPHGQLYWRAPLFTYIQSGSAAVFGLNEFALRFPAAVFGIFAIPVAYLLGRDLAGRAIGVLLSALIALSLWEIELSRYARFYTLFQLLFMIGIWSFYWGFLRDRLGGRVLFVAATLVALSIHDLGVMLGTLFLLVLPMRAFSTQRKVVYACIPLAALVAWKGVGWLLKWISEQYEAPSATRAIGSTTHPSLSAALSNWVGQPVKMPRFGYVLHAWQHHAWWLVLLALMSAFALLAITRAVAKLRRRPPVDPDLAATFDAMRDAAGRAGLGGLVGGMMAMFRPQPPISLPGAMGRVLLAGGMVIAAAAHQAALVLPLALLYLAFFVRGGRDLLERPFLVGVVTSWNFLVGWCLYLMLTDLEGWRQAPWKFFTYPDLEIYFLKWMRMGWPTVLLGSSVGALMLMRRAAGEARRDPEALGAWVILGGALLPLLAMGLMDWRFTESRYAFHIFPLLLTMYAALFVSIARMVSPVGVRALIIAGVLAVVLSFDAAPWNSVRPALRDYTSYRDPAAAIINRLPYATFHQDHRTPALYVRERLTPEDRVVVVGMPHQAAVSKYYAGRVDAVVCPPTVYTWLIEAHDGWRDPITYAQVVNSLPDLVDLLVRWQAEGRRVWVLSDRLIWAPRTFFLPKDLEDTFPRMLAQAEATGADGVSFATHFLPVTETSVER